MMGAVDPLDAATHSAKVLQMIRARVDAHSTQHRIGISKHKAAGDEYRKEIARLQRELRKAKGDMVEAPAKLRYSVWALTGTGIYHHKNPTASSVRAAFVAGATWRAGPNDKQRKDKTNALEKRAEEEAREPVSGLHKAEGQGPVRPLHEARIGGLLPDVACTRESTQREAEVPPVEH